MSPLSFQPSSLSRRHFLGGSPIGLGGVALQSLLAREARSATGEWQPPTGDPHFKPKAKSVILLFMRGGVSHMESFDNKPELTRLAGNTIPETEYKHVQDPERLKKVRVVVVNDANG